MPMEKKRIILAGLSRIAHYILGAMGTYPDVTVVGLWDAYADTAGTRPYGIPVQSLASAAEKTTGAESDYFDYIVVTALRDIDAVYRQLQRLTDEAKDKIVFLSDKTALHIFQCDSDFYGRLQKYQDDLKIFEDKTGEPLPKQTLYPMLFNWDAPAGTASTQYFYQDLWASKKIVRSLAAASEENRHWDVGSRVDGFILALLPYLDVTLVDIRPLAHDIENLSFIRADATTLSGIENQSVHSLSSLCAVEHFGLGGYGGDIDPEGDKKVCASFARVLKPGGHLYLSVPIGKDAIAFNAHRVYAPSTFISYFPDLTLTEFSVAGPDETGKLALMRNADMSQYENLDDSCLDNRYFGLFEFTKNDLGGTA